ncbi:probable maleylacetoacetate isomerase 1 [Ostrinia furnacalis]|uniref:probable maleylacetoacetate isomerase 1 n=1 Tax=Ostrinia furnacalis TaxID=93504 RepID=UPI00103F1891|nr:probable maleylacetoacetate isomerase 1 [Ostrinia furnacalis]
MESMAIIDYLEDTRPGPKLTPESPLAKARMREICEIIVSGIQPLQNFGLKPQFDTEEQYLKFSRHHCERGLQTLEELLKKSSGSYCVGDQLTVADLCLVPQLFNITTRLGMTIDKYQTLSALFAKLLAEPVFKETHPNSKQ